VKRLLLGPPAPALRSDVWALSPGDLDQARVGASGGAVFAALQRPWRWTGDGPDLSPKVLRELDQFGRVPPKIESRQASADGSVKLLLSAQGDAIEAVHMPRAVGTGRVTLCVSSQVGCAMGCTFCATASMGFRRQLSAGEIVAQVLVVVHALGPRHPSELNLVFMGMGEPLHNLENVARAIHILTTPAGLGVAPRRVTVSTSGLVPQIDELGALPDRPLLAVSLNATTDAVRRELMPVNRRYPLAELRAALERYPLRVRERITIEYVLLEGVNDSEDDAVRLADFCSTFSHHINLIPFNAHPHAPFRPPSETRIEQFMRTILGRRRTLVTVRRSRGRDIQGACGQLVQAAASASIALQVS
jgi:23S rRNA (adenine2503-C2)-methyltransferase